MALSECVVVGQVTAIEEKSVKLPIGKTKVEHQVAAFKVAHVIFGSPSLLMEELRVAFNKPVELKIGEELCLILMGTGEEKLYSVHMKEDIVAKDAERDLNQLKRCAKLLDKPMAGLKNEKDTFLTAALLVVRYRNPANGSKTEQISAEESRLILYAILEADWGKPEPETKLGPQFLFDHLGLTEKDNYKAPKKKGQDPRPAAENWLVDNVKSYRIQRFIQ